MIITSEIYNGLICILQDLEETEKINILFSGVDGGVGRGISFDSTEYGDVDLHFVFEGNKKRVCLKTTLDNCPVDLTGWNIRELENSISTEKAKKRINLVKLNDEQYDATHTLIFRMLSSPFVINIHEERIEKKRLNNYFVEKSAIEYFYIRGEQGYKKLIDMKEMDVSILLNTLHAIFSVEYIMKNHTFNFLHFSNLIDEIKTGEEIKFVKSLYTKYITMRFHEIKKCRIINLDRKLIVLIPRDDNILSYINNELSDMKEIINNS